MKGKLTQMFSTKKVLQVHTAILYDRYLNRILLSIYIQLVYLLQPILSTRPPAVNKNQCSWFDSWTPCSHEIRDINFLLNIKRTLFSYSFQDLLLFIHFHESHSKQFWLVITHFGFPVHIFTHIDIHINIPEDWGLALVIPIYKEEGKRFTCQIPAHLDLSVCLLNYILDACRTSYWIGL